MNREGKGRHSHHGAAGAICDDGCWGRCCAADALLRCRCCQGLLPREGQQPGEEALLGLDAAVEMLRWPALEMAVVEELRLLLVLPLLLRFWSARCWGLALDCKGRGDPGCCPGRWTGVRLGLVVAADSRPRWRAAMAGGGGDPGWLLRWLCAGQERGRPGDGRWWKPERRELSANGGCGWLGERR